jgi:hypothetical protein
LPYIATPAVGSNRSPIQLVPASFPGAKRPERDVEHSSSTNTAVKNEWILTSNIPSWSDREIFVFFYLLLSSFLDKRDTELSELLPFLQVATTMVIVMVIVRLKSESLLCLDAYLFLAVCMRLT